MSDLEIPDEARKAGWEALERAFARRLDLPQVYAAAVEAFAPLAVAAEVEPLADAFEPKDPPGFTVHVTPGSWLDREREMNERFALRLRARARELRGQS